MGTEKRERQKANRAMRQQQVEQAATRRRTLRIGALVVGAIAAVFVFVWIASMVLGDDEPTAPTDTIETVVTEAPDSSVPDTATETVPGEPVTTDG